MGHFAINEYHVQPRCMLRRERLKQCGSSDERRIISGERFTGVIGDIIIQAIL